MERESYETRKVEEECQINNAERRLLAKATDLSRRIASRSPEEIQQVEDRLTQVEIRNYNWLEKIRAQEAKSLARHANYKF